MKTAVTTWYPLVRQRDGTLEFRNGGGCLSLFGTPFLAAGVFETLIAVGAVRVSNADELPAWTWLLLLFMGLSFIGVGSWLVFGRRWMTLEPARGVAVRAQGLLVPMSRQVHLLEDHDAVLFLFEKGDSDADTADRHRVKLRARSTGADLELCSSATWQDAHEAAALTARFLGWPLVDRSSGHETVTAGGGGDTTLQERLRRSHDGRVSRPPSLHATVEECAGGIRVTLPGPPFRRSVFLGFVPGLVVAFAFAPGVARFLDQSRTPPIVQYVILGMAVLMLGFLPAMNVVRALLAAARAKTVVSASPAGIELEERGAWSSRRVTVGADDVIGLDYGTAAQEVQASRAAAEERALKMTGRPLPPGPDGRPSTARWARWIERMAKSDGICIKSRQGLFTFGVGLPDEEVRYLHDIIRAALCGESPSGEQ